MSNFSLGTTHDDDGDALADMPPLVYDEYMIDAEIEEEELTPTSSLSTNFSIESPSVTTSRGGNPKNDSWNRVTVCSEFFDGKNQHRVTCNGCHKTFGIWVSKPKIERVRLHTDNCSSFTTKPMINQSIQKHVMPTMGSKEKALFLRKISHWVYRTGMPFVKFDDPAFMEAMHILRPDCPTVTRKALAGDLLDKCHDEIMHAKDKVQRDGGLIALSSDGWSNTHGEPIVNYMCKHSGGSTFFEESVATGKTSHTGRWIADDIQRVIDKQKAKGIKSAGCTTDNTSANKLAWSLLQDTFPEQFFQGCVCHCFHLLVKDLVESVDVVGKTYAVTKEIIFFVLRHHKVLIELKERRSVDGVENLAKPSDTRWGRVLNSMDSLLKNEGYLNQMFNQQDFITAGSKTAADKRLRGELKEKINSPTLISELRTSITILKPFCIAIYQFESDDSTMSQVYHVFETLKTSIAEMVNVSEDVKTILLDKLARRWEFVYGDAHGIAYILDPLYMGQLMAKEDRDVCEQFMCEKYAYVGQEFQNDVFLELSLYKIYINSINPLRLKALKDGKISMYDWWKTNIDLKKFAHLTELVYMVFTVLPSAASCERNWSSFGFIQNKLRNRLGDKRTQALVFVYVNMKELDKKRKRAADEARGGDEEADSVDFPNFGDADDETEIEQG